MSAEQPMDGPAQPAPEPQTPDPEPAVKPRPDRSLTGFYVAICILLALVLPATWIWTLIPKWPFDAEEARRRQVEASERLGLPVEKTVDLGDGVVLELVLIPAGWFKMGSPTNEKDREVNEAQHWVVITRSFYLGKYEVTQEQWQKVMGTNASNFKGAKNPVESVTWDDSQEFLKKLNALPHPIPLPPGEGARVRGLFRLPTEAEWEYACRAGTKTRFCSGDADAGLADYAWYDANSGGTTHPAGTRKPNAWGLHDLHGNVWEWCGDWYGEYGGGWVPKRNPAGPATGSDRVLRGGSWNHTPYYCRSAHRIRYDPGYRQDCYGFRVVTAPAGH